MSATATTTRLLPPPTTASTTATSTATTTVSTSPQRSLRSLRKSSSFGLHVAASTPNLNALYSSQGTAAGSVGRLAPPSLARKASFAALTQRSLASIPDATETYALDSVLTTTTDGTGEPLPPLQRSKMAPLTPSGRPSTAGGDASLAIGDTVDVPGGMVGTVRFVGTVQGKKGSFVGVELNPEFAARGKNNGDVDGISYFTTSLPGAGMFLPVAKAARRDSPPNSAGSSFPLTPINGTAGGLRVGTQNSTNFTPPTPSLPKFSQSVGPGRAPSPQGKRPRMSLPRPDSPVRRLQMTPAARPPATTPSANKFPAAKYGSPTQNRFGASVRGTAGDPAKKPKMDRQTSVGPRSASALGQSSGFTDDETTPVGLQRTKTNGSIGSVSSFNLKMRPSSRANGVNEDEIDRLRSQLEDRDRQLKEQAATLAEMESSLAEVQTLMEHPDGLRLRRSSLEDKDAAQLRAMLREKNDKVAMLTAEFDAHRADFRSTIDTLELASTETERVYEKKIEELTAEIRELESNTSDVQVVAQQLKQLEELVQELEEGLEDARRGEAEARGEVEFLRGEVERTRSELRREREKAASALNGNGVSGPDRVVMSKELEQKEDEIRGLKAIIHSLSRDSIPGEPDKGNPKMHRHGESIDARMGREKMEREIQDLKAVLDDKLRREEELEREVEMLRRGSASNMHRVSSMTIGPAPQRSSLRDSRDTVILARGGGLNSMISNGHEPHMNSHPRSPEANHKRGPTLDTHPESDAYSTATETSTLWCEICETGGHDILTCTNMFGPEGAKTATNGVNGSDERTGKDVVREGLKLLSVPGHDEVKPAPLSPVKTKTPTGPPSVKILPNPMDSGPVAGKESGIVDVSKWCALCERDGHESVDCPFEDAF